MKTKWSQVAQNRSKVCVEKFRHNIHLGFYIDSGNRLAV